MAEESDELKAALMWAKDALTDVAKLGLLRETRAAAAALLLLIAVGERLAPVVALLLTTEGHITGSTPP